VIQQSATFYVCDTGPCGAPEPPAHASATARVATATVALCIQPLPMWWKRGGLRPLGVGCRGARRARLAKRGRLRGGGREGKEVGD
jgi:hypothetical protein